MAVTAQEVVDDVTGIAEQLSDRPTFLFGHSMGGWIAYEAALALEARGLEPAGVVVSGTPSPHALAARPADAAVSDEDILARCVAWGGIPDDLLQTEEFRRAAFPGIRADVLVTQDYRPAAAESSRRTLRAPLLALAGRDDDIAPSTQGAGWSQVGADWHGLKIVPGAHFFTLTSEKLVLNLLREFCTRVLLQRPVRSPCPSDTRRER